MLLGWWTPVGLYYGRPNHTVVVWNVRGLNNPARRNSINNAIFGSGASVVRLQETKIQNMDPQLVRHCLGPEFDQFFCAPALGTHGGIILACKSIYAQLSNPHLTANTVTAWVHFHGSVGWWFTGVYGP